jgi:hypothetical protein
MVASGAAQHILDAGGQDLSDLVGGMDNRKNRTGSQN